jgi:prepilin peptidase CpaA
LPFTEVARWALVIALALVLVIAAISDIKDRRIPNWTVIAVIVLFAGWILVAPASASLLSSLEAAAIAFVVTYALYAFRIFGAGDAKLFSALALFAGMKTILSFAVITTLVGGAIALVIMVLRPTRALVMFQLRGKGDYGRGIPYGVAIAAGSLLTLFGTMTGYLS